MDTLEKTHISISQWPEPHWHRSVSIADKGNLDFVLTIISNVCTRTTSLSESRSQILLYRLADFPSAVSTDQKLSPVLSDPQAMTWCRKTYPRNGRWNRTESHLKRRRRSKREIEGWKTHLFWSDSREKRFVIRSRLRCNVLLAETKVQCVVENPSISLPKTDTDDMTCKVLRFDGTWLRTKATEPFDHKLKHWNRCEKISFITEIGRNITWWFTSLLTRWNVFCLDVRRHDSQCKRLLRKSKIIFIKFAITET